tara:strand:- start:1211 stop:1849 length:639 start_codon:yes stop_codon:yes gene_type:complete
MKTINLIPLVVFLLCFQSVIHAQTLKNKIQKSVVEIGKTFPEIGTQRLKQLDQAAFLIFKKLEDSTQVDVLLLDNNNLETSQLTMIWLQAGMIYYGHSDMFNIQSAGITAKTEALSNLEVLEQYGFRIKNTNRENPNSYKVDYGPGNWVVYPKTLQSLKLNKENNLTIHLEKIASNDSNKNEVELLITDTQNIAREMMYMATRIDNLLQTNQ